MVLSLFSIELFYGRIIEEQRLLALGSWLLALGFWLLALGSWWKSGHL
jgi:hypothetical protein